jgi:type I restriction enzyme S subunit
MSFPRYESYRDSGVEWLGDVPEHWCLRKLKTIASFAGGGTPNRDNLAFWNGDIPWVSPKDMKA